MLAAATVVAVLLLVSGVYFVLIDSNGKHKVRREPAQHPSAGEVEADHERAHRAHAAATTQADGTIWIFGGVRSDGAVTAKHEGYDPVIDNWKGGDDLPVAGPARGGGDLAGKPGRARRLDDRGDAKRLPATRFGG